MIQGTPELKNDFGTGPSNGYFAVPIFLSIFQYREADLQKGESVCIDRCVAKYLDVHERIGKKLTDISMRDQDFQQRVAQGGQG